MNAPPLAAMLFALAIGAAIGFAGGYARCDVGGTTYIKRMDRLPATNLAPDD